MLFVIVVNEGVTRYLILVRRKVKVKEGGFPLFYIVSFPSMPSSFSGECNARHQGHGSVRVRAKCFFYCISTGSSEISADICTISQGAFLCTGLYLKM